MPAKAFLDTNILLYAISDDPAEAVKRTQARALMSGASGVDWGLSIQVLQEFYVNATAVKRGHAKAELNADQALAAIERFLSYPAIAITETLLRDAIRLKKRYKISYWDAAIVAAALELGATTIYSEDLTHGQSYDDAIVVNPFRVKKS